MELEKFEKAAKIVNKIREYEWHLKEIENLILKPQDYSDVYLYKCSQEGMRNFEIKVPLTEEYARGLIASINATYRRILQDLYKELESI